MLGCCCPLPSANAQKRRRFPVQVSSFQFPVQHFVGRTSTPHQIADICELHSTFGLISSPIPYPKESFHTCFGKLSPVPSCSLQFLSTSNFLSWRTKMYKRWWWTTGLVCARLDSPVTTRPAPCSPRSWAALSTPESW